MGVACMRCLGDESRWHAWSCLHWSPQTDEEREDFARLMAKAKQEVNGD